MMSTVLNYQVIYAKLNKFMTEISDFLHLKPSQKLAVNTNLRYTRYLSISTI